MTVPFRHVPAWWLTFCLLGLCPSASSHADAPTISSITPLGARPGHSAEVVVEGQHLQAATGLWASWGEQVAPIHAEDESAHFSVNIPKEVPLGFQALRVHSSDGVGELRLLIIDDLASVANESGNDSAEAAQQLTLPCAVDGRLDKLAGDYYQFEVAAGQQVSFDILARRLGSRLDPTLFLYREDGRELAYADDTEGLSGDAQLTHTFEAAGTYVLEVRDIRYDGGKEYDYRLRIGNFPCLNVPLPMGVRRGQRTRIDFAGISASDANPCWADVPADWPHPWFPVSTRRPDGDASGFALVTVSDAEEFLEHEPNDTFPQANQITLGTHINGRFDSPGDIDRYRFRAKSGQRYLMTGITRSRAAPTDLVLELLDASGKQVARVDDVNTAEGTLNQTFPADGEYVLSASDLFGRGGPQYAYRIEVVPYRPGFELSLAADHVNVPAGGIGIVTVNVTRHDYDGAIRLAAEGLPQGWESLPTMMGPGMASGVMTVRAPEGAVTESVLDNVRIVGKASTDDGQEIREVATLLDSFRSGRDPVQVVPLNVLQAFAVAAVPAAPFTLSVEPAEVVLGQHLKATVKIIASRGDQIDEPIELAAILDRTAFPRDVKLEMQPIAKGAGEVTLELTAGAKAPIGEFTVVLQGTHKQDKIKRTAIAAPINYRIAAPLAITADPGDRLLPRGGELHVKVDVLRNPALEGDIKLSFGQLPAGVMAAEVVVPADRSSAEIVLSATSEAAAGELSELKVRAAAVGNKQVTADTTLGTIAVE